VGATPVGISPQREQYLQQVVKRHKLSFDVLRDKGNQLASEFGLVFTLPNDLRELYSKYGIDLERFNGDDSWQLPIPGRFIIDSNSHPLRERRSRLHGAPRPERDGRCPPDP